MMFDVSSPNLNGKLFTFASNTSNTPLGVYPLMLQISSGQSCWHINDKALIYVRSDNQAKSLRLYVTCMQLLTLPVSLCAACRASCWVSIYSLSHRSWNGSRNMSKKHCAWCPGTAGNVPGISRNSGTADHCKASERNITGIQRLSRSARRRKKTRGIQTEGNTLPRITANKGHGMLVLS